ncbi:MAG: hypothetical protein M3442_18005 [Chloroflexota bacterium]|nr:hypothetical protein [Chloroflexota bacterium]
MDFVVGGEQISLEQQDVIRRLRGKEPPQHGRQKLFIDIGAKHWPVKAALAQATRPPLDVSSFPTSEAVRVLKRLGFTVTRRV